MNKCLLNSILAEEYVPGTQYFLLVKTNSKRRVAIMNLKTNLVTTEEENKTMCYQSSKSFFRKSGGRKTHAYNQVFNKLSCWFNPGWYLAECSPQLLSGSPHTAQLYSWLCNWHGDNECQPCVIKHHHMDCGLLLDHIRWCRQIHIHSKPWLKWVMIELEIMSGKKKKDLS